MRPLLVSAFVAITAQLAPAQSAQSAPDFKPLEFLVGSCWQGTFPDGKQTDEHCFDWMLDKKFIRDRHVVKNGPGPYAGETVYAWDAGAKQIVFTYYSSAGFVMKGQLIAPVDSIVFPSKIATANGEVEMRSVWTRRGPDTYHVTDMERGARGWNTTRQMDFRRTKGP